MKNVSWFCAVAIGIGLTACHHVGPLDDEGLSQTMQDPLEDQVDPESPDEVVFDYGGVDVLLVVDNSGSMDEEQQMLSTAVFTLVSALTDPLPGWPYPPVDDVRIGVVSSDMGLSWGGNPYQNGDGWPGDTPQGCGAVGDDGALQTYASGKSIYLQDGEIPCGEDSSQCPAGWTCNDIDENDIGVCDPVDDPSGPLACPTMDNPFAEAALDAPNEVLSEQVACLSSLGTSGCGFEQQLIAGVRGAEVNSGTFLRDGALLAVFAITDEDDCSIESNELFAETEVQNLADNKVNIACGLHPEHLFSPAELRQRMIAVKDGDADAVVFAALAGVPTDFACEGAGHMIAGCLEHPAMLGPVITEGDAFFFAPACERWEGDTLVTKARPAKRFVETAQEFQERGFVFSICNDDWQPVMDGFAKLILRAMWNLEVVDEEDSDDPPACSVVPAIGARRSSGAADLFGLLVQWES
jgi:hypothetical protein